MLWAYLGSMLFLRAQTVAEGERAGGQEHQEHGVV